MTSFLAFATWLGRELRRQGVSLPNAADALHTPLPIVSAWLDGTRLPSRTEQRLLAELLEVPEALLERLAHRSRPSEGGRPPEP